MQPKVTVYSTTICPYCDMMKNFLGQQNIAYTNVDIQKDQKAANRLVEKTGQMGVPQTQIGNEWVLGFDPNRVLKILNK